MADFNPSIYSIGDYYDINVTPSGGWQYDSTDPYGNPVVVVGFRDGTTITVKLNGEIIYIS